MSVLPFFQFLLVLSDHVIHAFCISLFLIVEALFESMLLGVEELLQLIELLFTLSVDFLKLLLMKSLLIF